MATITGRIFISGCVLLFILLASSVMVIKTAGLDNGSMQITPGSGLNITNHSISTIGNTGDFVAGPTPITIFRVELNQTTLPGPRDMGFGPSVIDLTIAPQLLAVIFLIVLICLIAGFVWKRREREIPNEQTIKK